MSALSKRIFASVLCPPALTSRATLKPRVYGLPTSDDVTIASARFRAVASIWSMLSPVSGAKRKAVSRAIFALLT